MRYPCGTTPLQRLYGMPGWMTVQCMPQVAITVCVAFVPPTLNPGTEQVGVPVSMREASRCLAACCIGMAYVCSEHCTVVGCLL